MDRLTHKKASGQQRANRVRTIIRSGSSRPRLSVHISNKHALAQIIDASGKTLVSVSSTQAKTAGTMSQKAVWVGQQLGQAAKKAKIIAVVFDRGGKKYHGRIKALAEAARGEGLEF